jgi:protein-L-isoaspartate(D-aspartate) O-methyltransferase
MKARTVKEMVKRQLKDRGISDQKLLDSFLSVARHEFVPEEYRHRAYEDHPLPIGEGQTISQPYIVALMAEALELRGDERVLDIGTGSGYAAAIMSGLCAEVYSVERIEALALRAQARLAELGYDNVHVLCGDGTLGWPEHAPYDAITIAAGGPAIPEALLAQLAPQGRLVMPVGPQSDQLLTRVVRSAESQFRYESLGPVRFVPLIGEQGIPE